MKSKLNSLCLLTLLLLKSTHALTEFDEILQVNSLFLISINSLYFISFVPKSENLEALLVNQQKKRLPDKKSIPCLLDRVFAVNHDYPDKSKWLLSYQNNLLTQEIFVVYPVHPRTRCFYDGYRSDGVSEDFESESESDQYDSESESDSSDSLNPQDQASTPVNPYFAEYDRRVGSFSQEPPWERQNLIMPLVSAGFYRSGISQRARCYHCDLVIFDCDEEQSIVEQHLSLGEHLRRTYSYQDQLLYCMNIRLPQLITERQRQHQQTAESSGQTQNESTTTEPEPEGNSENHEASRH